METLKIIGFATIAAVAYGILHDQVTAHVCVEYFTVAHPPIFPTESPFLLAIGWGIVATWWVGLPLGILLAGAARLGRNTKLSLVDLRRSIMLLMVISGGFALLSGFVGASLTALGVITLPGEWGAAIPTQKWAAFAFALWAHSASYIVGAVGGVLLTAFTLKRRLDT